MTRRAPESAIDLNCDLGEDPSRRNLDLELLHFVTSANIACGGHAGDDTSMSAMVESAAALGVNVGAHPSYPDRDNFGRMAMAMPPGDLRECVRSQVESLARICAARGVALRLVKPHGALYHAAMTDAAVANAIADAVGEVKGAENAILVGQAGAMGLAAWRFRGLPVAAEAFADRQYEPDGTLRARTRPAAVLTDPMQVADQSVTIARKGMVRAADGTRIPLEARTLCVHSDTPGAVEMVKFVRRMLSESGISVRPL